MRHMNHFLPMMIIDYIQNFMKTWANHLIHIFIFAFAEMISLAIMYFIVGFASYTHILLAIFHVLDTFIGFTLGVITFEFSNQKSQQILPPSSVVVVV